MRLAHIISPMESELLRTFATVAEVGTTTAATRLLHCSQPAISRRLGQLEAVVGAALFERTPSGMKLTAAGQALLPFAEAALAAIGDGLDAVKSVRDEHTGPVTVALVGTLAGTWITGAMRAVAARHPTVNLRLRTGTSVEVAELVRRAEATIGIRYARVEDPQLVNEDLFDERMVVVCAPDHPRARSHIRSLDALRDERWLAFPDRRPGPETSARHVHGALAAAGVADDAIVTIDSLTAQKRLVEAGFGIALMQETAVAEEAAAGTLTTIDTPAPVLSVPVVLVCRKNAFLSRAAQTLLDELRQEAALHAR
jgi:DNA-binding transcriptional LysR family regulator